MLDGNPNITSLIDLIKADLSSQMFRKHLGFHGLAWPKFEFEFVYYWVCRSLISKSKIYHESFNKGYFL